MSSTSTSSSDVVSTSDSADTTRRAAGVALTALERIESGETHAALTVAQLCRPADTLALDPRLLLRSPTQPPAAGGENRPLPFTQDGSSRDVADLACLLLVAHATISRDLAARALGWTLTRLEATLARPQAEVPALGVELARHGHSIRLTRTGDWNRTIKLATLQRVDEVTRATKARTARLVRALLAETPTREPRPPTPSPKRNLTSLIASYLFSIRLHKTCKERHLWSIAITHTRRGPAPRHPR